ncbi:MAG TPA: M20 family metallopeptidase [Candidatus Acidoferrum sp.]|jgi:glutamate carboxypeptidase
MPDTNLAKTFLQSLQPRLPQMLAVVEKFVTAESPSLEKPAADRCCALIAREWKKRAVRVERIAQKHRGDHLRITCTPQKSRSAGQLLVLGHYDTVYSSGTLAKMPFRVEGNKAFGPGIFDMKAGIMQALFALDAIIAAPEKISHKRIVFLWTSDEEIGSESSRKLLETEARRSDAVFVLEPALGPWGLLKTSRKGVGEAELIVHGRASHAGLAPEEGINAVHELARQITRMQSWNDPRRGITLNADIIEGGTRTNVIADHARTVIDLRATHLADMQRIEARLHKLKPILRGATLEIRGGFNRPPLERKMSTALFSQAKFVAAQINLPLGEYTAGGGSDGNLTAALGIPTLDGLGAVGDGAHSSHEHIIVNTMPALAALLAALLATT